MLIQIHNPIVYSCIGCFDALYTNEPGLVNVNNIIPDPSKLEGEVIPFTISLTDQIETVSYEATLIVLKEPTAEVVVD